MAAPLWTPSPQRIADANITAFARRVESRHRVALPDYDALWRWSIDHPQAFWREMWDDAGVIGAPGARVLVDADRMPGARFFPDATLNFARNLLERRPVDEAGDALVFRGEDKTRSRVSHAELRATVSRVARALGAMGVHAGDRIAAIVPNMPETLISAAASVTSTPFGNSTGYFAIRDIALSLRHDAQHFATNIRGAGTAVGHDAFRRRNDGDA